MNMFGFSDCSALPKKDHLHSVALYSICFGTLYLFFSSLVNSELF